MGFSRFYLGRHSVDQILLGMLFGTLITHFFHYCMKPHMFDPSFKPDAKQMTSDKHWRNFYIALFVWIILVSQVAVIYFYVDNYVHIPEAWIDNLRQLCTRGVRLTETFHHQNMATEGYMILLPAHYFWKAF